MATIRFTRNIQRHVPCPSRPVEGVSVATALDGYFNDVPDARAYVLDERGRLRDHMAIFIDGRPVQDREGLSDAIEPESVIDVWQALSGG